MLPPPILASFHKLITFISTTRMGILQSLVDDIGKDFIKSVIIRDACFKAGYTIRDFTRLALVSKQVMGWLLTSFSMLECWHFNHLVSTLPTSQQLRLPQTPKLEYCKEYPYPYDTTGRFALWKGAPASHIPVNGLVWIITDDDITTECADHGRMLMAMRKPGYGTQILRRMWPTASPTERRVYDVSIYSDVANYSERWKRYPWQFYPLFDDALAMALTHLRYRGDQINLKRGLSNIGFVEDAVPPPDTKRRRLIGTRLPITFEDIMIIQDIWEYVVRRFLTRRTRARLRCVNKKTLYTMDSRFIIPKWITEMPFVRDTRAFYRMCDWFDHLDCWYEMTMADRNELRPVISGHVSYNSIDGEYGTYIKLLFDSKSPEGRAEFVFDSERDDVEVITRANMKRLKIGEPMGNTTLEFIVKQHFIARTLQERDTAVCALEGALGNELGDSADGDDDDGVELFQDLASEPERREDVVLE